MIICRFAAAVRYQNCVMAAIDLAIDMIGIFLGLQVEGRTVIAAVGKQRSLFGVPDRRLFYEP
ncbi:MAG: hypothetical protein AAF098_16090 [Pseudomonadota bacterium]